MKKYVKIFRLMAVVVFLAAGLGPLSASAQKKGGGGVIRLETTVIEGRVQKPNAFFINTKASIVYEDLEVKESFVDEIVDVVEGGNF